MTTEMSEPEIVWMATLDNNKWVCQVVRTGEYTGRLMVHEDGKPGENILSEDVGLAYGAVFGPDVGDVADWQERCIQAVDGQADDRAT